jgi:3-oxoadipate enol-lactonase
MQVLADDGTRIDVAVDGRGDDAIVLLAGFSLTHEIWNEEISSLAQTHRVIRPDLRGMGNSGVPAGPYLMDTLAADVAGVLDACGIERATIVGHSLGGYVSLAFARMFSERVSRLALVSSRIDADTPEVARRRRALADRVESEASIEPVVDAYLGVLTATETATDRPDLVNGLRRMLSGTRPAGAAAMLRGMAERNPSDDIAGDLEIPVLVVAGAFDALVPLQQARAAADAFPRARLVVCEHSGHMPMLEEPGRVTASLQELLSE